MGYYEFCVSGLIAKDQGKDNITLRALSGLKNDVSSFVKVLYK